MALIFTRRGWHGHPEELGELWLSKDGRTARAFACTHPRGVELRLEVSGELLPESMAFLRDDEPLFELADSWRDRFFARGWTTE